MIQNFINGAYREGRAGKRFRDLDPCTGRLVAEVSEAGKEDVDDAVQAARAALNGPWGKLTLAQRCDLLYAVADEIDRRKEDFLAAEVADTGKPAPWLRTWISRAARRTSASSPMPSAMSPRSASQAPRPTASRR